MHGAQAIMRVSSVRYLTPKSRGDTTSSNRASPVAGRREKEIVFEGSAGPRELLEGILRQVNAAKRSMSGQKDGDTKQEGLELSYYQSLRSKENEEVEKLEAFCDRFVSAVKSIGELSDESWVADAHVRLHRHFFAKQRQWSPAQGATRTGSRRQRRRRPDAPPDRGAAEAIRRMGRRGSLRRKRSTSFGTDAD